MTDLSHTQAPAADQTQPSAAEGRKAYTPPQLTLLSARETESGTPSPMPESSIYVS